MSDGTASAPDIIHKRDLRGDRGTKTPMEVEWWHEQGRNWKFRVIDDRHKLAKGKPFREWGFEPDEKPPKWALRENLTLEPPKPPKRKLGPKSVSGNTKAPKPKKK